VSEDIKKQKGDWKTHIANWKTSMRHLRDAGLEVLCYNFMPVLDWTRTDLAWERPNGARCMRFDLIDFAAFDIHILQRRGAAEDFPEAVVAEAAERFAMMDDARREQLAGNVVYGLPGAAEKFTLEDVRAHLAEYDQISEAQLQSNLIDFLSEVAPLAEEIGMRLCCHPDDPPFPLLGLPRIMSTQAQYETILRAVDLPANGVTLCTGSLGARPDNNPVEIMRALGDRVHFLHLRNVTIEGTALMNSLFEDEHLSGHTDMVAMVAEVVAEERRRRAAGRADWSIPMRPDHGQDILDDIGRAAQPGYPAIGRLKGLAELRGVFRSFEHPLLAGKA
jgi:mannonate dehydratase